MATAAALGAALGLAGCSPGPMIDRLPEAAGGLPAGAPARPATPYQYPAVHDMPPPRATRTMTDEELQKAEKDLRAVRDRQAGREGQAAASGTSRAKSSKNTGAKTNP